MKRMFLFLFAAGFLIADERDPADHAERAKAAQQRGDFRTAAAEWETIAKLRPNVPEVYSNLGMMRHFAQDYPKAIAAFQQAVRLNPKLTAPHLFLGIDYYLTSLPNQAIPELKQALALEPSSALAQKWLSMSYFQAGDFYSSVRELNAAIAQSPGDAELHFWLSRTYLKLLFNSYARIRELVPDSTYLLRLRDNSADSRDDNPNVSALLSLQTELKSRPSDVSVWFNMGRAAKMLALKELNTFLERSPQSYRVPQLQAELALAEGDDQKAIDLYRKAIAASSDPVQLHLAIANIHMSHHEYAEAIPEYEAELRADPYALTALERLGEAYAELNDPAHAEAYLKRALTVDPNGFDVHRILGKVYFERGDYKAAVANYLQAVSNTGKPPAPLLFQLSKAYRKMGNTVEADRWLARFQSQLASEHQEIQQHLEKATKP
jgi:tetratricopeptide (TPR) repeat protein